MHKHVPIRDKFPQVKPEPKPLGRLAAAEQAIRSGAWEPTRYEEPATSVPTNREGFTLSPTEC